MNLKRYKNDIMLILALLLLAGIFWGILQFVKKQGGEVVLSVDGEVVEILPLNKDTSLAFVPGGGEGNTITVENGKVCVSEANCPDLTCVRQGWIQYEGESIVCLPHRLVVTVRGVKTSVDASTW